MRLTERTDSVCMDDRLTKLERFLRDEGPFAEQDLLALNAAAAALVAPNRIEAAKLIHRERTALTRRLHWARKLGVAFLQRWPN